MLNVLKSNRPAALQQQVEAVAKQQYKSAYLPEERLRSMKSGAPCTGLPFWVWGVCGQHAKFGW
jgi:hypothetical protein